MPEAPSSFDHAISLNYVFTNHMGDVSKFEKFNLLKDPAVEVA